MLRSNNNRKNGFTLIELILVLAVIGILTSIAYPGYLNVIARARRHDGQTALLELATQMEQYYSANNTYQTATLATGAPTDIRNNTRSPEGWYHLAITEQTDSNYTLQATAVDAQARNDRPCATLTFNSSGVKSASPNETDTNHSCW